MDVTNRTISVAYGGGTNSTALLLRFHELGIRPDLILFADTGGERPEVYKFIEEFNAWLVEHGMPPIITVKKGGMQETLEENCLRKAMLPSIAYGFKSCSEKYKIRAQEKFCNNHEPFEAVWARGEKIIKVIGYDAGESRRAKIESTAKYDFWHPLIEWEWHREECVAIIERYGMKAQKSACFFCFAGETEIVTASGLQKIGSLSGKTVNLLVPRKNGNYTDGKHGRREYAPTGVWQPCEITEFGVQRLVNLHVRREQTRKLIRCTSEHRWYLRGGSVATTSDLKPGDVFDDCYLPHHKAAALRPVRNRNRNRFWKVERVELTNSAEPVYCATVPGAERFVLADGIVTGNCPSSTKKEILELRETHPALLERALKIEDTAMANLDTVKGLGRRFNWREFLESVKNGGEVKDSYADRTETPCGCYDGA